MSTLEDALTDNRRAVDDFIAAARAVAPTKWAEPRAPGKWSPGQVAEHLAISYELGRKVLTGDAPFPRLPRPLRAVLRWWVVRPVLRSGKFPSGFKTSKPFIPASVPAPLDATCARLTGAAATFADEHAARARTGAETLVHPVFGTLTLAEYVRFNAAHARHHMGQLSPRG